MNGYRPPVIATRLLIAANVLVFLLMYRDRGSFDWDNRFLLKWGGNLGALSLHGQYWRWLTACFLHANAFHILSNMTCLASFGFTLERRFGTWKFVLLYTVTGILSVFVSSVVEPNVVGVGASGATNGLFGAICAVRLFDRSIMTKTQFASTALLAIGVNLLPGVGVVAHAAGFASGLLIGFALWQRERVVPRKPVTQPRWQRVASTVGERIGAAVLPRSDSAAGKLIGRLVARYRSDVVFHITTDVAVMSTAVLLFFMNAPTTPVAAAKSTTASSTPASSSQPKPATVATATPQQAPQAAASAATTTPSVPAVPFQFTNDVTHPSLAHFIVVDLDDSPFASSAPADQPRLAAAARTLRSQQFAAMLEVLSDANRADVNVAFLRGLAELNLPGQAKAQASEQDLRVASEAGNRQASALFGRLLVKPREGIVKDLTEGRSLIEDAAAAGDRLAQRLAGVAYLSGEFGVVNATKARNLFHAAAEAGDTTAMLFYAFTLSWALGGPADQRAAADFLHRAAAAGLTEAQMILGTWLLDRYKQKVLDDPREGVEWLERAYQKGHSISALRSLAVFYGDQNHPPPWYDKGKQSELINLCSGLSDRYCQLVNGWAFQFGIGRSRDLVKAFAHYQVATELGHPVAPKSLATVEALLKNPADKVAAIELSETIRANLKPAAPEWVMQYVGAEPPPSIWAAASYGRSSVKQPAPLATASPSINDGSSTLRIKESAAAKSDRSVAPPSTPGPRVQPNVVPMSPAPAPEAAGSSIILRRPN